MHRVNSSPQLSPRPPHSGLRPEGVFRDPRTPEGVDVVREKYPNGKECFFLHGLPHGKWDMEFTNGDQKPGNFIFGLLHDFGFMCLQDGSGYYGFSLRGEPNWFGAKVCPDGREFVGYFFRGKLHGGGGESYTRMGGDLSGSAM